MTISEVTFGLQEGEVDSITVIEMLNVSKNNLRQLVFRKILVPVRKHKRRSVFLLSDVERVKASRAQSVPSA
jgi:hypothetical protein